MGHHSEAFIGIDTSKLKNAVAIADAGRGGEMRYLGEFDTTVSATTKWITKLAARYDKLTFCVVRQHAFGMTKPGRPATACTG